jgi:hypothetical protein
MTIPALFVGLFDDAALFPPGNAPMQAAVAGHREYAQSWYHDLVGRFVCPADRLAELAKVAEHAELAEPAHGVQETQFRGSGTAITVPEGIPALADALWAARSHGWMRVSVIEIPVPAGEFGTGLAMLNAATTQGIGVFVEVAVPEVTEVVCRELVAAGLGLKLRTGGSTPAAFPSASSLGAAVDAAVGSGVRFKCTAGLHNAIAHHDPSTGFDHHGFLNVLLAIHDSSAGHGAAAALAEPDGNEVIRRVGTLTPQEVGVVRRSFASIGSCSITDPLTDLEKAGLVTAP